MLVGVSQRNDDKRSESEVEKENGGFLRSEESCFDVIGLSEGEVENKAWEIAAFGKRLICIRKIK